MCGIYISNIAFNDDEVEKKLKSIAFRGPDHSEFQKKEGVIFGHVRLSILDLNERSNQPFSYDKYTMVYNGEIYNFEEIQQKLIDLGYSFNTTSDTEVLLKGYAQWGEGVLDRINGMFAFAIYNKETNEVFCARDRLGVKPFYYYWKDGFFEICSQLKPFISNNSKLSLDAVSAYLDLGYVPSPMSIVDEVYKLPPGCFMRINLNEGKMSIDSFWDLKKVEDRKITYKQAKKELHSLLIDAIKIRMHADVPVGTFLSGGIDSALVSSIASEISEDPINTYTIGFENPKFDESLVAEKFSTIIGANHHKEICSIDNVFDMLPKLFEVYHEPFADNSALPSLLLSKIIKKEISVALAGDGGDESFLGYDRFDKLTTFQKIKLIPYSLRKLVASMDMKFLFKERSEAIKNVLRKKDTNSFIWGLLTGFDSLQKKKRTSVNEFYNKYNKLGSNAYQNLADLTIKLYLENDCNVKVDRASMGFGVEVRSPFLDYRIVEFARSLPVEYRYKNGEKKYILKDILSEYIPKKVYDQPKKGFSIPIGSWIKNELKDEIVSSLNDNFLNSVPNLNVKKFKRQLKSHMDNKYDYSFNIWKLYVLSQWVKNNDIQI